MLLVSLRSLFRSVFPECSHTLVFCVSRRCTLTTSRRLLHPSVLLNVPPYDKIRDELCRNLPDSCLIADDGLLSVVTQYMVLEASPESIPDELDISGESPYKCASPNQSSDVINRSTTVAVPVSHHCHGVDELNLHTHQSAREPEIFLQNQQDHGYSVSVSQKRRNRVSDLHLGLCLGRSLGYELSVFESQRHSFNTLFSYLCLHSRRIFKYQPCVFTFY